MTATFLDITILTIISISTLLGVIYGLINVIISTISFFGTIVLAFFIFPYVESIINIYVDNSILATILAGISSYLLSILLFTILKSLVKKLTMPLSGNFIDKFLGLLFGLARGFVFTGIFLLCLVSLASKKPVTKDTLKNMEYVADEKPEWLFSSRSFSYFSLMFRGFNKTFPSLYDYTYDFIISKTEDIKVNKKLEPADKTYSSEADEPTSLEKLDHMLNHFLKENKNK
jgi:uncharacterized membrane protein required for colicin V production